MAGRPLAHRLATSRDLPRDLRRSRALWVGSLALLAISRRPVLGRVACGLFARWHADCLQATDGMVLACKNSDCKPFKTVVSCTYGWRTCGRALHGGAAGMQQVPASRASSVPEPCPATRYRSRRGWHADCAAECDAGVHCTRMHKKGAGTGQLQNGRLQFARRCATMLYSGWRAWGGPTGQ